MEACRHKLWVDDTDSCSQISCDNPEVQKDSTSVSEHNETPSPQSLPPLSAVDDHSAQTSKVQFRPETYKTGFCWKEECLQSQCLDYHHPMERRRNHLTYSYGPKRCRHVYQGMWGDPSNCRLGDTCSFAHTANEVRYHPKVYKTAECRLRPCKAGSTCPYSHPAELHSTSTTDLETLVTVPPSTLPAEPALSSVENSVPEPEVQAISEVSSCSEEKETQSSDEGPSPSATIEPLPVQTTDVKPIVVALLQEYSDLRELYKTQQSHLETLTSELETVRKQLSSALGKRVCTICNQEEFTKVLQPCGHTQCDRCAKQTRTAERCQVCSSPISSMCRVRLA